MERMHEHCMARRVLMAGVSGVRGRERPRLGLMDGVKALGSSGMTALGSNARKIGRSEESWCICR